MNRPKVKFQTFGCKLNFAETSTISDHMAEAGFEVLAPDAGEEPDLIVVNTCSVTELADKKCRQSIRSMAGRNPGAAIVVTGCYAQLKPAEVASLPSVVAVVGNDRKERIVNYALDWIRRRDAISPDVIESKLMRHFTPSCSRGDRTRYFLKIQDGCDYFCSYCTIPFARGRSRSASIGEIVEQARGVAAAGGREIVLTGVNIGDFGKPSGEKFFDLLKRLDEVDGIERYRISSIEPN
ncbi:MAG: radical SAM protein, partial [Paramuribaculum sp.]|nr:radical SAM protein [Paramuribaculum sp.]